MGTSMRKLFKVLVFSLLAVSVAGPSFAIDKCGTGKRITCVVDGDTFWLKGEKIRMQGYDAPETTTNVCGGAYEKALGNKATSRVIQLLNGSGVAIKRTGKDRYGRTLAVVLVNGRDIGDILVSERLARRWPDGREFWCE